MSDLLIRCSSLGKLMTEPRSKSEVLSQTAKTMIEDLFRANEFGIVKDFTSKYTDKGIQLEDEAIQLAGEVLEWEFIVKNETRFNNEFVTGEPDVLSDELLADIKCSWNIHTFPLFDSELKNKDYYWQMQGYMMLTDKPQAELVYCLLNTPIEIVEDEIRREHWRLNLLDEDLDVRQFFLEQHNFDHIPQKARVKRFIVKRDDKSIEKIKEKVILAREYYEQLKTML